VQRFFVATMCAVMVMGVGIASAQLGICEDPEGALEQLVFLSLMKEAGVGPYDLPEMLQGYAQYRDMMDGLNERRDALKAEIEKAIAAGESGYALAGKANDLMALDREILDTKQSAIRETESALAAVDYAKLVLLVSDLDEVIEEVRAVLAGESVEEEDEVELSPEEALLDGLMSFSEKLEEGDLKGAMDAVSDDFSHYEYGDKQGLMDFLQVAADMGYLEELEISLDDAKVALDGDTATVEEVAVEGLFGNATIELQGAKEDGVWKLVSIEIYGI